MALNFDAVINTPEESVDMKAGLETLQGVSDAARCIAETLLTEHVPQRQTHKKDVRTILKQSFKGSYGHIFGLEIYDEDAQKKFKKIGRAVFLELMDYFLNEAVYKEHKRDLTDAASRVVKELGDKAGVLTKQLRKSAMHNLHAVPEKFGYDVKIRYRKNRDDQTVLATFDRNTAGTISAKLAREDVKIRAAITRLNINTGNGRLSVEGSDDTVAFGFHGLYARVPIAVKEPISENLAYNNLRESDQRKYLEIVVRPIKLRDGKVIKYIVKEL